MLFLRKGAAAGGVSDMAAIFLKRGFHRLHHEIEPVSDIDLGGTGIKIQV